MNAAHAPSADVISLSILTRLRELLAKREFEVKFSIPNPIWTYHFNRRLAIADKLWRAQCEKLTAREELWSEEEKATFQNEVFMWCQLVKQEIIMYARLGTQVTAAEFDDLCKCRGFTEEAKEFLRGVIKAYGLGKAL